MAEKGSFWSSLPGVLTGIAGLATAVVALLSLAASQGWIGGGAGDGDDAGSAAGGDAPIQLEVEPSAIEFQPVPTSREATVTVANAGTEPFRVDAPKIKGPDAELFEADGSACTQVPPGQSCEVVVTFDPPSTPGRPSATLVISANDEARSVEVPIEATALLG